MDVLCNHASMNFSRQRAFELVDGVYDNFVYCRYDLDIYSNFKIESIENSVFVPYEESYNLISDIFCISPMHYAKHYFLFDSFQRLHSSDFEDSFVNFLDSTKKYGSENIRIHREERYCPHMILLRNLYNNGIPYSLYNFPVRLHK
jgi:hypothetical protein